MWDGLPDVNIDSLHSCSRISVLHLSYYSLSYPHIHNISTKPHFSVGFVCDKALFRGRIFLWNWGERRKPQPLSTTCKSWCVHPPRHMSSYFFTCTGWETTGSPALMRSEGGRPQVWDLTGDLDVLLWAHVTASNQEQDINKSLSFCWHTWGNNLF